MVARSSVTDAQASSAPVYTPSHLLLRTLARQHRCTLIHDGHSLAHTGTQLSTSRPWCITSSFLFSHEEGYQ
jgi:hypothetical protein